MKKTIKFIFEYFSIILVIAVTVLAIMVHLSDNKIENNISQVGKISIAFVFDSRVYRSGLPSAYYYYIKNERYENSCSRPPGMNVVSKFYKVKYLPANPKKSIILDFTHPVPKDSVQYYFPQGQNPFKMEVKW